jgi:hypothetical protein
VGVVVAQLRQGITPQKIALTVAIGCVLGVFPVLGSTTLLCFLAGLLLKLNQPIIQLVNYLIYPLQFAGIYFFIRIGEWLTRTPPLQFSIAGLIQQFRAAPLHFFAAVWNDRAARRAGLDADGTVRGGRAVLCVAAGAAPTGAAASNRSRCQCGLNSFVCG